MAPTKSTLLKWSQEEVDILVEMTNDQLELEAQDKSMMISWTTHWRKVSQRLKENGHARTPTACRGIWRRGIMEQQANRDAAGDEWDDSEHEILVHMTKKQLNLEKVDQANVIPWAKHWKKVSLQLDESGYSRTPDNCAAYWSLIGSDIVGDAPDLTGADEDEDPDAPDASMEDADDENDEGQSPASVDEVENEIENVNESENENENEDENEDEDEVMEDDEPEDAQPVEVAPPPSPQASSKQSAWGVDEYENLLGLLKARRQREADEGLEFLTGSKLWVEIAESHRESGFDRSHEGCKTYWNKQGRDRSSFDERVKLSPKVPKVTGSDLNIIFYEKEPSPQGVIKTAPSANPVSEPSKATSRSSTWSHVNDVEPEEAIVVPRNPAIDVLKKHQEQHAAESSASPSRPKSPELIFAEYEPDLSQEQVQRQKKRDSSLNSQTQSGVSEKGTSTVKYGLTSFRFTPEQRALLESEAHRTGGTLDGGRKTELAEELGVEEKTIRNWFNNYNVKARRSQGSTPAGAQAPAFDEIHDGPQHVHIQAASTPTPASYGFAPVNGGIPKRPYFEEGSPDHPSKRAQMESTIDNLPVKSGFNPVNGHMSRQTSQNSGGRVLRVSGYNHDSSMMRVDNNIVRRESQSSPQANQLPTGVSHTPDGPRPADRFTAISNNPAEVAPPPPHLQLKSSSQPISNPAAEPTILNPPRHPLPGHAAPHPAPATYPIMSRETENLQTSNRPRAAEPPQPRIMNGMYGWSNEPQSAAEPRQPLQNDDHAPIPGPSQPSPNQPWPRIPPNMQQEATYRPPPKPFTSPAPAQEPSSRPRTASTPSDEHPRIQAIRHIENFQAEIQTLTQATRARTERVTALTKEISVYTNERAKINAAKEAEITRVMRELEAHYESVQVGYRQQEERLGREKEVEVEGLKKTAGELVRKEKGLARWQGIVEYYEAEGDDAP